MYIVYVYFPNNVYYNKAYSVDVVRLLAWLSEVINSDFPSSSSYCSLENVVSIHSFITHHAS